MNTFKNSIAGLIIISAVQCGKSDVKTGNIKDIYICRYEKNNTTYVSKFGKITLQPH